MQELDERLERRLEALYLDRELQHVAGLHFLAMLYLVDLHKIVLGKLLYPAAPGGVRRFAGGEHRHRGLLGLVELVPLAGFGDELLLLLVLVGRSVVAFRSPLPRAFRVHEPHRDRDGIENDHADYGDCRLLLQSGRVHSSASSHLHSRSNLYLPPFCEPIWPISTTLKTGSSSPPISTRASLNS